MSFNLRTKEDLREIWDEIYTESWANSCQVYEDDHKNIKMSMLLKCVYHTHKAAIVGLDKEKDRLRKLCAEKDKIIEELEEEIVRLKSRCIGEDVKLESPTQHDANELADDPLAIFNMLNKPVKRLSFDEENVDQEKELKKIKVELPSFKEDTVFVSETPEADYFVSPNLLNVGIIPDTFEVNDHVMLCQEERVPNNQRTPVSRAKSPILFAKPRTKKASNMSPSLLERMNEVSNKSPDKCASSQSPVKPSTSKLNVVGPLSPRQSSNYEDEKPKCEKLTPVKKFNSPSKKSGKENVYEKPKSDKIKKLSLRKGTSFINGKITLEINPPDKTWKPASMIQTKITHFKSGNNMKKSTKIGMSEEEQLELALEQSVETHKLETIAANDEQYFSPSPKKSKSKMLQECSEQSFDDQNKTFFEGAYAILDGNLDNESSPTKQDIMTNDKQLKESNTSCVPILSSLETKYLDLYDKLPDVPKNGPGFAYQGPPVRKKEEREKLRGWECHECKKFYEIYCKTLNTQEREKVIGKCSRHRQELPFISNSPPGLWEVAEMNTLHGTTQVAELKVSRKKQGSRLIDLAVKATPSLEYDS